MHVLGPFLIAAAKDGECAAGPGDSGGPVYVPDQANTQATGRGTIRGGNKKAGAKCIDAAGKTITGSSLVLFTPLETSDSKGSLQAAYPKVTLLKG
jgi:hypothetical protein